MGSNAKKMKKRSSRKAVPKRKERDKSSTTIIFLTIIIVVIIIIFAIILVLLSILINDIENELDETKTELDDTKSQLEEANQNKIPRPSIIPNSLTLFQGEKLILDGSGSNDIDGKLIEYKWDFGNGDYASGNSTEYSYKEVGMHKVTLTVTDNNNIGNSTSITITIECAVEITITEIESGFSSLIISLEMQNNGPDTARIDSEYWTLLTSSDESYKVGYTSGDNQIFSGKSVEVDLTFYDVVGNPKTLIYDYEYYYLEVNLLTV